VNEWLDSTGIPALAMAAVGGCVLGTVGLYVWLWSLS
jgi:hypothetical protein